MNLLPFIVSGLVSGSVYGLAGVGLVLTYKTSRIFNFGHGAVATVAAYIFYTLHVQHHVPVALAIVIALVLAGGVLGAALERFGRSLSSSPLVVRVLGTVGLLILVQSAVTIIYGTKEVRIVPAFFGGGVLRIGSTAVTYTQIVIFGIAVLATAGLYAYFRFARKGVAMRAVVDDAELLDMTGESPAGVRRLAWIIGTTFAAVSGVMPAPLLTQLDATTLTLLVVQAFGAAAIGMFTSLPLTFAGGLAIGIVASLCTKYFTSGVLGQLPTALPFLILIVVLLVTPSRRLAPPPVLPTRVTSFWRAPSPLQFVGAAGALVFLAFVPSFADVHINAWISFLANAILFMSLGFLVRLSGQVSLCHVTFAAIGVSAFSHLVVDGHMPWLVGLLLASLIAVPVGLLLAIPAIRLSGLYLALLSLGFGILVQYMFYAQHWMFGQAGVGLIVPRPKLGALDFTADKNYYYLVLAISVVTAGVLVVLERSRLGRLLRALATGRTALTTSGASVNVTLCLVFCLSAFLAAFAGALDGGSIGIVTANGYSPMVSWSYFAAILITVGGQPWYAFITAAAVIIVPSYVSGENVTNYLTLIFGVLAILHAMHPTQVIPDSVRARLDRIPRPRLLKPARSSTSAGPAEQPVRSAASAIGTPRTGTDGAAAGLAVTDLKVRFGGLMAVKGATLQVPRGRITGLIGPNGAGKTTTFNACSGLVRPSGGSIELDGRNILRMNTAARARLGLGRTFQRMELGEELTVAENVSLGREGGFAGLNPLAHLVSGRKQARLIAKATADAMALCGIDDLADRQVSELSTGKRRLVELARCLAGPFNILLLDEPSSGLDKFETAQFATILRRAADERGLAVLIVEHDMSLVVEVCDYIYVLDFGSPLFEGEPDAVMSSSAVRAAYLGEEAVGRLDTATEPTGALG